MDYQTICRKNGKIKVGDVYISRAYMGNGWNIAKSKWAIPADISKLSGIALQEAYKVHIETNLKNDIPELAYQKLGCWCKNENICHAKVLKELVQQYMNCPTETRQNSTTESYPIMIIDRIPIYTATKRTKKKFATKATVATIAELPIQPSQPIQPIQPIQPSQPIQSNIDKFFDPKNMDRMPIQHLIYKPIVVYSNVLPKDVLQKSENGITILYESLQACMQLPFDSMLYTHVMSLQKAAPIKGLCKFMETNKEWLPFYCYVARITKNKKNDRLQMILSETPAAVSNNDNSYKVHLASQLSPLIANRFIVKDDLIYVRDYAITHVGPKKRVVIVTSLEKVV